MTAAARLRDARLWKLALAILALAYVVLHVAAVFRDAANWDELALLRRTQDSLATGKLLSGGRPGLGAIALIPFVHGCRDPMSVLRAARVAWSLVTFVQLAGLFAFLRAATRRTEHAWHAAALGTALLGCVPLFLRWSLQVRNDQPAVAAALWAGAVLLTGRDRTWRAALSGLLTGVGFLFSQKAVYVTGLVAVVTLGDLYIDGAVTWRREVRRGAAFLAGAVATLVVYHMIVRIAFAPPSPISLDQGLDLMTFYRWVLRWRLYGAIVPTVVPHIALLGLVLAAALRAFRRDTPQRRPLLVALVVVLLGIGVGRFHTASFPYFWITIGVFPATAIALGWAGIRELLPRAHVGVAAAAWLALTLVGAHYRLETLADTQEVQRDTFAFVDHALPADARGFHTDGGLFCRADPDPFPVYFGQHIGTRFGGADGPQHVAAFIAEFRTRPVAFLIETNRVPFPAEITAFWGDHYVPYARVVRLAGHRFTGAAGSRASFDLVVAGRYRWLASGRLSIEGKTLGNGNIVTLPAGRHTADLLDPITDGSLVLAVDTPPAPTDVPFYDPWQIVELSGVRRRWW